MTIECIEDEVDAKREFTVEAAFLLSALGIMPG